MHAELKNKQKHKPYCCYSALLRHQLIGCTDNFLTFGLFVVCWQGTWGISNHLASKSALRLDFSTQSFAHPSQFWKPLCWSAHTKTSGVNHQPQSWNNHIRAEHVANPHSPFLPLMPKHIGLRGLCNHVGGYFKMERDNQSTWQTWEKRSCHTTYCRLFLDCGPVVKQSGTFWMFLTSAQIHRSVVQHWCCVMHTMWGMQAFVHTTASIESTRRETGGGEGV